MRILLMLLAAVTLTVSAWAQPNAAAVTNAASFALPGLPNSGIAQGSMFIIWGSGLSAGSGSATFPLQTNLAGTTIQVTSGGRTVNAWPVLLLADRVYAVLPSSTTVGDATLTVSYNSQTSRPLSFRVVRATFGMFTVNQAGSGPAIVQNFVSQADQPINLVDKPARPGQTVTLWGTGLGPVTGDEAAGALAPAQVTDDVEIYVGGRRANVVYKGRSGCCAGLDQIVFVVPDGVDGCYAPIVVKIGDAVSNFGSMAVAARGDVCSDINLSSSDLETAKSKGNFASGDISLSRMISKITAAGQSVDMKQDNGSGSFWRYNYNDLIRTSGGGSGMGAVVNSCMVYQFSGETGEPKEIFQPTALNAGPQITITRGGGNVKNIAWDAQTKGYYAKLGGGMQIQLPPGVTLPPGVSLPGADPDYLEAGDYVISGPGGPDVGAFSVRLTLRQMLSWTNMNNINDVPRNTGLTVQYTGSDPSLPVAITGMSVNATLKVGAGFVCLAPGNATSFTVPSYVLSALPPTTGTNAIGNLAVVGVAARAPFTATGLDSAEASISAINSKTVNYR